MKKLKILGSIALCVVVFFVDFSDTKVSGTGKFVVTSFDDLGAIGSYQISCGGNVVAEGDLGTEGETVFVQIESYDYTIPPRMYFPFYREGQMKASVVFDVSTETHPGFRDKASLKKDFLKQGFFLAPDLTVRADLRADLRRVIVEGIKKTAVIPSTSEMIESIEGAKHVRSLASE